MLTLDFKVISVGISPNQRKGPYVVTLRCKQAMQVMDDICVYADSLDGLALGSDLRANFYDEPIQSGAANPVKGETLCDTNA